MNNYCIGLLIIMFIYFYFQRNIEGLDIPDRYVDKDLQDYFKLGTGGHIELSDKQKKKYKEKKSFIHKKHKHLKNMDAELARKNFKSCSDSRNYHSCDVKLRKLPSTYIRNLPIIKLDDSNIYNKLSICPQTYSKNMELLKKKKIFGQYSGYTENGYLDRTRYIQVKLGKPPLPMNPDFFMKGGGTYA